MRRSPLARKTPLRRSGGLARTRAKPRPAASTCQMGRCRRPSYGFLLGYLRCDVHYADKLVGDFVRTRDGRCLRCGSGASLDAAHIMRRGYLAVRWSVGPSPTDPWNNIIALCRPCHSWQGEHPLEGKAWFRSLGFDLNNLEYLALHDPPADPVDVIEEFGGAA